jgi:phosphoenolpyruvate carboxylase
LIDLVVREQAGDAMADTMRRIHRLAVERRAGLPDAELRMIAELDRLDAGGLKTVIRWLNMFFDLANVVEDRHRIDVLKTRARKALQDGEPRRESITAAITKMKDRGMSAAEVQRWLDKLVIEPVFTAHPSEAKRRTTRQLLRGIRQLLPRLGGVDAGEVEAELLAQLSILWQSDLVRPDRPPVMSEVSRGLYFASTLWEVVPRTYNDLRRSLEATYPHHPFEIPKFLKFSTWIGGDRDGHPFVTAEITKKTFARLRRAALEGHLDICRKLQKQVVMSDNQVPSSPDLAKRVREATEEFDGLSRHVDPISPHETYRKFLRMVEFRLERTLQCTGTGGRQSGAYPDIETFLAELGLLQKSMQVNKGRRIAAQHLQPWVDLADTFGFHFASLDIRQNSEIHRVCLEEVFRLQSKDNRLDPVEGLKACFVEGKEPSPIDPFELEPASKEVFDTFLLLAAEYERWGSRPVGGYIISMTHSEEDVLAVLWLWKTAWLQSHENTDNLPLLPIIPLFETIDDLQRSESILDSLFTNPVYQAYLFEGGNRSQIAMVGYSDSTKDGGYVSACWELHQAQEKLAAVAEKHHIGLTLFHGRGGALGRGGGPAARAILSLPQQAVNCHLRVTEQGEVLSERYDDPVIAHRHLEQIIHATLAVSTRPPRITDQRWVEAMQKLALASLERYRGLVEHPGFLGYFDKSTPISEIETLPIGSRPARRGKRTSLSDLRAIPWTFAWTQSRLMMPAWFGLGTAVRKFVDDQDRDWSLLRAMYAGWPMFRAMVDNAELALAKADKVVAKAYSELSGKEEDGIWDMVSEEFELCRGAILMIQESNALLENIGCLQASLDHRNPYVDPLSFAQILLLKRIREEDADDGILDLVRLTIQGVASGLRTTG